MHRSQRAHCCVSSLERLLSIGGMPSSCCSDKSGISRLLGDVYRWSLTDAVTSSLIFSIVLLLSCTIFCCFFLFFFFFFLFFFLFMSLRWVTIVSGWAETAGIDADDAGVDVVVVVKSSVLTENGRKRWMKPDERLSFFHTILDWNCCCCCWIFFRFNCFRFEAVAGAKCTSSFTTTGWYSVNSCPSKMSVFLRRLPCCRVIPCCRYKNKMINGWRTYKRENGVRWNATFCQ